MSEICLSDISWHVGNTLPCHGMSWLKKTCLLKVFLALFVHILFGGCLYSPLRSNLDVEMPNYREEFAWKFNVIVRIMMMQQSIKYHMTSDEQQASQENPNGLGYRCHNALHHSLCNKQ